MSTVDVVPPLSPEATEWLAGLPPEVAEQVSGLPTDAIEWLADDALEIEANQRIENGDDPEHAEFAFAKSSRMRLPACARARGWSCVLGRAFS